MTPNQAKLLDAALPHGWLRLVQDVLKSQGLYYDYPFISRVKNAKKQHAAIEAALMQVVEAEAARRRAVSDTLKAAAEL